MRKNLKFDSPRDSATRDAPTARRGARGDRSSERDGRASSVRTRERRDDDARRRETTTRRTGALDAVTIDDATIDRGMATVEPETKRLKTEDGEKENVALQHGERGEGAGEELDV